VEEHQRFGVQLHDLPGQLPAVDILAQLEEDGGASLAELGRELGPGGSDSPEERLQSIGEILVGELERVKARLDEDLVRNLEDSLEADALLAGLPLAGPSSFGLLFLGASPDPADALDVSAIEANLVGVKAQRVIPVSDPEFWRDGALVRVVVGVLENLQEEICRIRIQLVGYPATSRLLLLPTIRRERGV
jgi:hypothetical protein